MLPTRYGYTTLAAKKEAEPCLSCPPILVIPFFFVKIAKVKKIQSQSCRVCMDLWSLGQLSSGSHGRWSAPHIFATKINGHVVHSNEQQQWYSAIATGLAFLTKTLLTAAAGLAYTQLLWYILRSKSFTLAGVNATFAVLHNPWGFFNREL